MDKEKQRKYNKKWYSQNKDKEGARHKKYYEENRDYFKQKQKEWRDNNKEHLKELKRNSYQRNREKAIDTVKKYRAKNLDRIKQKSRDNYKKNPSLYKERRIKYKYGMTYEDKEKIFQSQEGRCAICLKPFSMHELHIDHDHITNEVRGLLCPHCNTSLGLLKEDTDILKNMINYLESKQR